MEGDGIVRWEIEPLQRDRRGVDERLRMAAGPVVRKLGTRLMDLPAGAPIRRRVLTQMIRVAFAANNRGDYDAMLSGLHPESVLQPPSKGEGALGFEAEYHGPEGAREFIEQWKSGFDYFRYEPREIADGGGDSFAVRVGVFGRVAGSGAELADEWATVYTLRNGLVSRMENLYEWDAALAALERRLAQAR